MLVVWFEPLFADFAFFKSSSQLERREASLDKLKTMYVATDFGLNT